MTFLLVYLYDYYLICLPMVMHMHIKLMNTFGNWLIATHFSKARYSLFVLKVPLNPSWLVISLQHEMLFLHICSLLLLSSCFVITVCKGMCYWATTVQSCQVQSCCFGEFMHLYFCSKDTHTVAVSKYFSSWTISLFFWQHNCTSVCKMIVKILIQVFWLHK